MIRVDNVTMAYGSKVILDNISFEVKDKCITGFLGSNGAGKSTTMNILTGYIIPKSGEVYIADHSMQKEPLKAKRNIGYLPEIPPVYNDMRIEEYIEYVSDLKKINNKKEETQRVMNLLDINDRRYDFIKNLSKGYRQRVGFAGALVGNPGILILDEPLVGLDPEESRRTRELLKELKKNHCIFISSHILSEIEELCTDIIMLKDGHIVIDDSAKAIKGSMRANQYNVQIKGNKEEILDILLKYGNVRNADCIGEIEPGVYEFAVVSKNTRDIRDSLLSYLVGKKYNVYGIVKQSVSLEDAFINANKNEEE